MSIFARKPLARGIKMTTQAFFDLFVALRTAFGVNAGTAPTINRDNYAEQNAPFVVALHIPALYTNRASLFGTPDMPFPIPLCLPPLQEFFDGTGSIANGFVASATTPVIVLDEISVSFDQGGEPAVISGDFAVPNVGLLDYANIVGLTLHLAIVEKAMNATTAGAPWTPDREIASVTIGGAQVQPGVLQSSVAFLSSFSRLNPFILADIGAKLDPYKTYVMMLTFMDGTNLPTQNIALPSLQINFKLHHPIVARTQSNIQNAPVLTKHGQSMWQVGAPPLGNVLVDSTAGGKGVQDPFVVGSTGGVPTNAAFDVAIRQGLEGGLFKDGDVPPQEALLDDSAYTVIAVPMWQNCGPTSVNQAVSEDIASLIPWGGAAPFAGPCCDRRIITLHHPLEIHHVIAAQSYLNSGLATQLHPSAATHTTAIGVGISTGKRGDDERDQQIALLSFAANAGAPMDKIRTTPTAQTLFQDPAAKWDLELYPVPLVGFAASPGKGFVNQGSPIFVAKGDSKTRTRSNIAGAPPLTAGIETTLECLWSFGDTAGLSGAPANRVYAGVGGNWIFIIGKVPLQKPAARMG